MFKIIIVFFFCTTVLSQNPVDKCLLLQKINTVIAQNHYSPKPIDDSLSVYVFDNFMDEMDESRTLFSKSEFDLLSKHRYQLDNYTKDNNCVFMDEFVQLYIKAIERKITILEKIEKTSLKLHGNDTIRFFKKALPFELKIEDFEGLYKKRIRFDIMENIANQSKNLDSLQTNFKTLENEARKIIFEGLYCKLKNQLSPEKGVLTTFWERFLNIYCTYFDAHTNYLSNDDKNSFLSSVSTSNFSLGLTVSFNEKEEIVIQEIEPGSPAFLSKKFSEGDIILEISNEEGEQFKVSCTSIATISNLIYSDSYKKIGVTIKKNDGTIITIPLEKELLKASNNSVYSFIIKNGNQKIGYLKIPSFYADFENNTAQGCADDVAKEIVKLKKDSITGLLIDLEDNGGGSMEEASKLGAMFIDSGPLTVLMNNKKQQTIIKDFNRGVVYSGPIVVLINGNSASASEYFASLLQDYKRAIIIGKKSLGKASMQVILPLDYKNQQDFIKITIEKFYRITGQSCQINGVIPDVELPKLFDDMLQREDKYSTALVNDVIKSRERFNKMVFPNEKIILENSKKRVSENDTFKEIVTLNEAINATYDNPKLNVVMNFESIFKYIHLTDGIWEKIKKISNRKTKIIAENTSFETEILKLSSSLQKINTLKIAEIETNPYLEEGFNLLENSILLKQ